MWLIRISAFVVSRRRRRVIVRKYPWGKWSSAVVTYEFNKWTYCSFQKRDYHATLSPVLTPLDALIFGWDHSSSRVCVCARTILFFPFLGRLSARSRRLPSFSTPVTFVKNTIEGSRDLTRLISQRNNARAHRVRESAQEHAHEHTTLNITTSCCSVSHTWQPLILSS